MYNIVSYLISNYSSILIPRLFPGKTSLCKALAHKLSIRLSERYTYGQLVEINSHSLFSKWFSEVGSFSACTSRIQLLKQYL